MPTKNHVLSYFGFFDKTCMFQILKIQIGIAYVELIMYTVMLTPILNKLMNKVYMVSNPTLR